MPVSKALACCLVPVVVQLPQPGAGGDHTNPTLIFIRTLLKGTQKAFSAYLSITTIARPNPVVGCPSRDAAGMVTVIADAGPPQGQVGPSRQIHSL